MANLQVQAGMVESSPRFHEKLLWDLNNKVDILAAGGIINYDYQPGGYKQQNRTFPNDGYKNRPSSPFNGQQRPPFELKCQPSGTCPFFTYEEKINMKKLSDLSLTDAEKTRQVMESSGRFEMLDKDARDSAAKEVVDKVMALIGDHRDKSK